MIKKSKQYLAYSVLVIGSVLSDSAITRSA